MLVSPARDPPICPHVRCCARVPPRGDATRLRNDREHSRATGRRVPYRTLLFAFSVSQPANDRCGSAGSCPVSRPDLGRRERQPRDQAVVRRLEQLMQPSLARRIDASIEAMNGKTITRRSQQQPKDLPRTGGVEIPSVEHVPGPNHQPTDRLPVSHRGLECITPRRRIEQGQDLDHAQPRQATLQHRRGPGIARGRPNVRLSPAGCGRQRLTRRHGRDWRRACGIGSEAKGGHTVARVRRLDSGRRVSACTPNSVLELRL